MKYVRWAIELVIVVCWTLWRGLRSLGKILGNRMEKVEQERSCSIEVSGGRCNRPAHFLLIVTVLDIHKEHAFHAGSGIRCCKEHHPIHCDAHGRGMLANETGIMLMQRNLSVERIYMIERLHG